MARPSKLPEVETVLLEALRIGMYATDACDYAGISLDSYQRWMTRGEEGDPEYEDFYLQAKRAEAEAQKTAIEALRSHFSAAAIAPRDFLARRFPDKWAPRDTHIIQQTGTVLHVHALMPPPDPAALAGLLGYDVLDADEIESGEFLMGAPDTAG